VVSGKYIGMDVHQATVSVAVMDSRGRVVMDSVIETKAATIIEFIQGVRGTLWVTFEEPWLKAAGNRTPSPVGCQRAGGSE